MKVLIAGRSRHVGLPVALLLQGNSDGAHAVSGGYSGGVGVGGGATFRLKPNLVMTSLACVGAHYSLSC